VVLADNGRITHGWPGREPDRVCTCHGPYGIPVNAFFNSGAQHYNFPDPGSILVFAAPYCCLPGATAIDLLDPCNRDVGASYIRLLRHGTLCFFATLES